MKKRVLLIGAKGRIGSGFVEEYLDKNYGKKYELILGVHDKRFRDRRFKVKIISLEDRKSLSRAMNGVDVVVSLAANPSPDAKFKDLINPNIIGAYNVFDIAVKKKVKRVVFASSVHAVYDNLGRSRPLAADRRQGLEKKEVDSRISPRPSDFYGASKVFGESLCYVFSRNYKLSCLAIRIGAYTADNKMKGVCYSRKDYEHVISQRDMGQLLHKAIISPKKVRFGIFNGVSKNKKMNMSLVEARKILKYKPEDDTYKLCREFLK